MYIPPRKQTVLTRAGYIGLQIRSMNKRDAVKSSKDCNDCYVDPTPLHKACLSNVNQNGN